MPDDVDEPNETDVDVPDGNDVDEREEDIQQEEKSTFEFKNHYASYILLKSTFVECKNKPPEKYPNCTPLKWNIYAITGGFGYSIISGFIEKDFGLDLVPRLINNHDMVIRKVVENRLNGNRIYEERRNRSMSNLNSETDFSNIYRELEFNANEDILLKLGVIDSNEEKINKNIITKDSFRISKQLSIGEINSLIERIDKIQYEKEKFALSYFKPAKKRTRC